MNNLENPGLRINEEMLTILNETRKWTMFIAILGFAGILFFVIMAFSIGTIIEIPQHVMPFSNYTFTIIYLLLAVVYFFPVLYLYKFSIGVKKSFKDLSPESLLAAFINLKALYKYIGILFIIMLTFYVITFIIGIFGGAMIF